MWALRLAIGAVGLAILIAVLLYVISSLTNVLP
jgi:hypothetical protein